MERQLPPSPLFNGEDRVKKQMWPLCPCSCWPSGAWEALNGDLESVGALGEDLTGQHAQEGRPARRLARFRFWRLPRLQAQKGVSQDFLLITEVLSLFPFSHVFCPLTFISHKSQLPLAP